MTITELKIDQTTTVLRLEGQFTYTQRGVFQEAIRKTCQQGARQIVLDLSEVLILDSAALGLLMVTYRLLSNERRRLVLARPRTNVKQVIELAGLHEIIPLSDGGDLGELRKSA
ncbi:STAS domain-containing protein [Nitrospira sp. Nam80]